MLQRIPESISDAIASFDLPSMPQVLLRLLRLTESDDAPVADVVGAVGMDPALSVQIVMAASSTQGNSGVELTSLDRCVEALGPRLVGTIAACMAIRCVFDRSGGERNVDLQGFWTHSLCVAELARAIAVQLGRNDGEEVYLAGLLHDVGQLALLGGLGGRYGALLAWSRDEEALLALERPELGSDHSAVGAWLIDQWRLPSFVADAVLFHHCSPTEIGTADILSRIVWSAHRVAGWAADRFAEGEAAFERGVIETMLGLLSGSLVELRREADRRVADAMTSLGVDVGAESSPLPRSSHLPFETAGVPERRAADEQIEAAVRDMAVLTPLRRNLAAIEDEKDALLAIREAARILFGLGGLGRQAFLLTRDGVTLSGVDIVGQPRLLRQSFDLPLANGGSLAARVAAGNEARFVLRDEAQSKGASLADIQIARAFGSDGVLYLPLPGRDRPMGVMAFGVSEAQCRQCERQLDWMARFARLAAATLESRQNAETRERHVAADLMSRFEQRARQVAHEAGNPLSIITNYLKIVADRLPESAGVHHELDILKEEIDRVAKIVRQLNDKPARPAVTDEVDVNAVIEGMAALYRESLFSSRGIMLDLILNEHLPAIPGNRDQIKQILLNLWKNASEAVPSGGRLVVSTANGMRQGGRDYIEIRLADTGPGLPTEVIDNIFQPLDPARRPGRAGMGLSIVASLVKGLDGQITFQSRAGQGTTFVILLPKSERSEQ